MMDDCKADDNEENGPGDSHGEPHSMPELVNFTTSQLLDELLSRFESSVFAGVHSRTDSLDFYHRRWWGGNMQCLGLCEYMKDTILTSFKGGCEDAKE